MPCELLVVRANDIHHIENRGAGGTKKEDVIENLMALERSVHILYGDKVSHMQFLENAHEHFMRTQTPYIEVNPNHESFDLLKGTPYESKLIHERSILKGMEMNRT